ncbi:hypothetical protein AA14_24310 [Salmonella enterica]|nr:hypothetical protein [Salmonella enterica]ECX6012007.1 hypothetical protein [Salmonella enterica subsp. enterica serovar Rubislaw]EEJ9527350.1 hypothetical protein [Salmonella enterica subsp. enterica serovar Rubislaw]
MLVAQESNEWDFMWTALSELPENRELPAPALAENFGELWEYMETTESYHILFGKRYYHYFRHRMHPIKCTDYLIKTQASRNFSYDEYFINKW